MSLVIHILHRDEDEDIIKSTIVNALNIIELNCIHPIVEKKEGEEYFEIPESELEVLYSNGERNKLTTAHSTVFRLLSEEDIIIETSNLQKFEEAYLIALLQQGISFEAVENDEVEADAEDSG